MQSGDVQAKYPASRAYEEGLDERLKNSQYGIGYLTLFCAWVPAARITIFASSNR